MSQLSINGSGGGGGTNIITITGDLGGAISPDGAGNFNLLGLGAIATVGIGVSNEIDITVDTATTSVLGVTMLATNAETIAGTVTDHAVVPSSLAAKLGVQTQFAVPYGNTTAGAFLWTSAATDGQVILGATGAAPEFADLTSSDGSITFTPGANTLDLTVTSGAVMLSLTGNTGGPVVPDGAGNIDLLGTGPIATVDTGANTMTISVVTATTALLGVTTLATDAETIAGTVTDHAVVPSSLAAKLGTQTANAMPYGNGSTMAFGWTSAGTDGQIPIAATGSSPEFASITSTGATITITPGANTLNLETASGGGMLTWTEVTSTGPTAMAVNNGYIANNASTVNLTLPSTAAIGAIIRVTGKGAGGWEIAQNAGQTIYFGTSTTTTGAGGSLASTADRDTVELVCVTADDDWNVLSSLGNITVV